MVPGLLSTDEETEPRGPSDWVPRSKVRFTRHVLRSQGSMRTLDMGNYHANREETK